MMRVVPGSLDDLDEEYARNRGDLDTVAFPDVPEVEPPPRRFVVGGWLPAACLSALYGTGGIGKSLLAQQLATHVATGRPFLGAAVAQAPVLGLFAEDDDEELIRRQWRINKALGLRFSDLGNLHVQGRAGLENALAIYPARGAPIARPLFHEIAEKARTLKAGLIILDNRAQMLLCDENDRAAATWCANLCAGLARATGAAVLLIGHVAKAENSEFSGSTAWDAVVRSRWWLRRDDKNEAPELILARVKSNYAESDVARLAWTNGILEPVDAAHASEPSRLARQLREGAAAQKFLDLLDQLTLQGRNVSHSKMARASYAPKVMNQLNGDFGCGEYERAMELLFAEGRIIANAEVGRTNRRQPVYGIARSGQNLS